MKIVHSLWTKPVVLDEQAGRVNGGWPTWEHYWRSWALSARQAHDTHGRIELVTDTLGKQVLVDQLKLPYADVHVILDDVNAHPALWAYGKILTYQHMARLGEPFLHIDADVYIWQPLPDRITTAAIAAQHVEDRATYPPYDLIYTNPLKTFRRLMKVLPPSWAAHADEGKALNTGLFGGHDLNTIFAYCDEATTLVEHPANAPAWHLLAQTSHQNLAWTNMLVEQLTARCAMADRSRTVELLTAIDHATVTHLMNGKAACATG